MRDFALADALRSLEKDSWLVGSCCNLRGNEARLADSGVGDYRVMDGFADSIRVVRVYRVRHRREVLSLRNQDIAYGLKPIS